MSFEPLPKGISAHVFEVGNLYGRQLVAIRYLPESKLIHGNVEASYLTLLTKVSREPVLFAPVLVKVMTEFGEIDDYTVSTVQDLEEFSFIWVTIHYSGTGNHIKEIVVTAKDASSPLVKYDLFSDENPLAEFWKQGWEPWHRGKFFDKKTLTQHSQIFRSPEKAPAGEGYGYKHLRIPYRFRDGKLRPGPIEEVED